MAVDTFGMMRGVRCAQLPHGAKCVAMMILSRTGDGNASWASIRTLGTDAALKPTATREALKQLADAGLLLRRDRPGRSSLIEMNPEPLLALAAKESAEAAARKKERRQARALATAEVQPLRDADCTPSHTKGQGTAKRGTPLRTPGLTPPESGAEIPNQIPKEKQTGNTTTKAASAAAVASLLSFGMNPKAAAEVARQMVPGEAELAISWAKDHDLGPGLIVTSIRDGQRPWNRDSEEEARRAAEVEATLDRLGIK
jgi:hypothetical protein